MRCDTREVCTQGDREPMGLQKEETNPATSCASSAASFWFLAICYLKNFPKK